MMVSVSTSYFLTETDLAIEVEVTSDGDYDYSTVRIDLAQLGAAIEKSRENKENNK